MNWVYNLVHIRKHKGQRDAEYNNAHRETKDERTRFNKSIVTVCR